MRSERTELAAEVKVAADAGGGAETEGTRGRSKRSLRRPAFVLRYWSFVILALPLAALACGFWLPNRLLTDGGAPMLNAPGANFAQEIEAMKLVTSRYQAVVATNTYLGESTAAELDEVRSALQASGRNGLEVERIVKAHANERAILESAVGAAAARTSWPAAAPTNSPPVLPPGSVRVVDALPAEFADYFEGAIAWHSGNTNLAVAAWERLLRRPAGERRFRSTWAAFMLGKARWETEPRRAIASFQQTRSLATNGFADRLGLAASSLGWEARVELRRGRFERAIDLYLEQVETGDPSALLSLRMAAGMALQENARSLQSLAVHPRAQRIITAYLVSGGASDPPVDVDNPVKEAVLKVLDQQTWIAAPTNGWHALESPALLWLDAVEKAGIRDLDSAEKLALAAYQAGYFDRAHRWLTHTREQPAARWLRAKLALRDGQFDEAAKLWAGLAREFPPASFNPATGTRAEPSANAAKSTVLLERLGIDEREGGPDAGRHLLGEWGALRLARREYVEALDAMLRGGYWTDAAYVADRVLTVDELKSYVDRAWPVSVRRKNGEGGVGDAAGEPGRVEGPDPSTEDEGGRDGGRARLSGQMPRGWLAWRLVRSGRPAEARAYFSTAELPVLDAYLHALQVRQERGRPAAERATILWSAAESVMASGLSVFTAPVETEWRVSGGFDYTNSPPARLMPVAGPIFLPATGDEVQRVRQTGATNAAWYFRYVAANLAWDAAVLMPDQKSETALVLWQAGTWLKVADPVAADRFYKALVRRCGRTLLGQEADRKRWFPSEEVARCMTYDAQ